METVNEIKNRLLENIENDIGENIKINNSYTIAEVNAFALMFYSLQLYGEQIRQDSFIDTATVKGIEGWGNTIQLPRKPAVATVIKCRGTSILEGADVLTEYDDIPEIMQRRDGTRYKITEYFTNRPPNSDLLNAPLSNQYDYIFTCLTSGIEGNKIEVGDKLYSDVLPESDWDITEVVVIEIITQGEEEEDLELWRAQIKSDINSYYATGTVSWYWREALTLTGTDGNKLVTHVYPYSSKTNPGQVILYVANNNSDDYSVSDDIINEIKQEFSSRNLLWGGSGTLGIIPVDVKNVIVNNNYGVEVTGLTVSLNTLTDLETLKSEIRKRIADYFKSREPYITGISVVKNDVLDVNDIIAIVKNYLNELDEGVIFTKIELLDLANTVVNKYVLLEGERAIPREIGWNV